MRCESGGEWQNGRKGLLECKEVLCIPLTTLVPGLVELEQLPQVALLFSTDLWLTGRARGLEMLLFAKQCSAWFARV